MAKKETISLFIINNARKYFRNTWIHRIPLTSWIYQRLFLATFKDAEKEIIFRDNQFIVPTKDTTVVPSMISGEYESFELDLFRKLLNKNGVILDIGANIGVYSIESSTLLGPKGKIYAFEPIPENQDILKRNIELNKATNIEIVCAGVGDKHTKLKIYLAENSIGTHTAGKVSDSFIEVEQTTIDSFATRYKIKPDLIKMDIEGYEGAALEGGLQIIKKHQPILFIEFSSHHLELCGYSPLKHARNLLSLYKYCYLIDERNKKTQLVTNPDELAKLYNGNLILSAKTLNLNSV